MQPYSLEQSILEGNIETKNLFEYVQKYAAYLELYDIEKGIFSAVMKIGLVWAVQIDQNSCSKVAPWKLLTKPDSIRGSGGF